MAGTGGVTGAGGMTGRAIAWRPVTWRRMTLRCVALVTGTAGMLGLPFMLFRCKHRDRHQCQDENRLPQNVATTDKQTHHSLQIS
jgi:hypothetical protein